MQVENEAVLERLTQEIYELAGEEFNINFSKTIGCHPLKIELPLTKKTKPAIPRCWCLGTPSSHRSCLRFLNTAKLLRFSRPMSSVFKTGFGRREDSYLCTGRRRPDACLVWIPTYNILNCLEQGRLIRKAFVPEEENSVLVEFGLFTDRIARLGPYFRRWAFDQCLSDGASTSTAKVRVFTLKNLKMWRRTTVAMQKAVNFGVV